MHMACVVADCMQKGLLAGPAALAVPVFEQGEMAQLEFYACVFFPSVCRSSRRQSMTRPSLDIFQRPKLGELGHQSTWRGTKCVKFSAACVRMMATFQKETRTSHSTNSHYISVSRVWTNFSCETVVSCRQVGFKCFEFNFGFTCCSRYKQNYTVSF